MGRKFFLEELLQNLNVIKYSVDNNISFEGTSINSKTLSLGNIFFAIKGEKVDGHDFISEAIKNGASVCIIDHVIDEIEPQKIPFILVDDVLKNLFLLAKYCRKKIKGKIIAVTGSAGKTTTKNWLTEVLQLFGKTSSTYANQNTTLGGALTLTNTDKDTDFCIIEAGMNSYGEMSLTSNLIKPDIAIITNVKPVHIGNFNFFSDIVNEKASIVDGMPDQSIIFLNKDELPFDDIKNIFSQKGKKLKIFSYGHNVCDCILKQKQFDGDNFLLKTRIFDKDLNLHVQNIGEQFLLNIVVILGIIDILELDLNKALKKIFELDLYPGSGLVSELQTTRGKIKIIDESYSANPASVVCAIKKLAQMEGQRRIAILGDMYELGDYLYSGFDEIFNCLIANKIDLVFTSGVEIKYLFERLPQKMQGGHSENVDTSMINDLINDGDIFLIKGSHGINLGKGRMYEFIKKLGSYSI